MFLLWIPAENYSFKEIKAGVCLGEAVDWVQMVCLADPQQSIDSIRWLASGKEGILVPRRSNSWWRQSRAHHWRQKSYDWQSQWHHWRNLPWGNIQALWKHLISRNPQDSTKRRPKRQFDPWKLNSWCDSKQKLQNVSNWARQKRAQDLSCQFWQLRRYDENTRQVS